MSVIFIYKSIYKYNKTTKGIRVFICYLNSYNQHKEMFSQESAVFLSLFYYGLFINIVCSAFVNIHLVKAS